METNNADSNCRGRCCRINLSIQHKKKRRETEIILFTKNEEIAYSPCAIPLVLGGCIESFDDIIIHDTDYYWEKNIQIHLSTTVTNVDSDNKSITFKKDADTQTITYDKLVLAPGSDFIVPDFEIDNMNNIYR